MWRSASRQPLGRLGDLEKASGICAGNAGRHSAGAAVRRGLLPLRLDPQGVLFRGIEQYMLDMYDNEEMLHALMAFLRDEQIREFEFYEKEHLLEYNTTPYINSQTWLGSGGICYTDELPTDSGLPAAMATTAVWGKARKPSGVGSHTVQRVRAGLSAAHYGAFWSGGLRLLRGTRQ